MWKVWIYAICVISIIYGVWVMIDKGYDDTISYEESNLILEEMKSNIEDENRYEYDKFYETYFINKNNQLEINRIVNFNIFKSIKEINDSKEYYEQLKTGKNQLVIEELQKLSIEEANKLNLINQQNKEYKPYGFLNITDIYEFIDEYNIRINRTVNLYTIYSKEQIEAEVKKYELNKSSEDYLLWNARQNNYNLLAVKI